MAHRFPIGTQYLRRRGRQLDLCTVFEQLTTTNSRGEVVREFYWSTHTFCGSAVTDYDVVDMTIARGVGMLIHSRMSIGSRRSDATLERRQAEANTRFDELDPRPSEDVRAACVSFAVGVV